MALRVAVVVCCAFAFGTAPASAGVLSVTTQTSPATKYEPAQSTDTVRYMAGPGEVNDVEGARIGTDDVLTFSDTAGVTPGSGCTAVSPQIVRCLIAHSFSGISASLGDGDDRYVDSIGSEIDGGTGDDVLDGSTVRGGAGDDVLSGHEADGGPGADRLDAHTVSYADASGPVNVDLRDRRHAGEAGEDELGVAVQDVVGGPFADELTGDERDNDLDGAGGHDRLDGGGGDDSLGGGNGNDLILGSAGDDDLSGGNGDDRIDGGTGGDVIYGGFGRDSIRGGPGRDRLSGDEGDDRIDGGSGPDYLDGYFGADVLTSRDGGIDALSCGPPEHPNAGSLARADARDLVRGCGHVKRSSRARAVLLSPRQDDGPSLRVELGCSQDVGHGCPGALQLLVDGRVVDRLSVRMAPGAGRGFRLHAPRRRFVTATAGCRVLPVTVRFSGATTTRLATTLSANDAACGRHRPSPALSVTNW
jgi:Ca2+-binding RTX toxin-like protein